MLKSLLLCDGKEAFKCKTWCRDTAHRRRRCHCRRSRNSFNGDIKVSAHSDQILARIGDTGHTCIGYHRTALPALQAAYDIFRNVWCRMLVIAEQRLFYIKMIEKLDGNSCILGTDEIHFRQDPDSSVGDILQIADGCSHNVKFSWHFIQSFHRSFRRSVQALGLFPRFRWYKAAEAPA